MAEGGDQEVQQASRRQGRVRSPARFTGEGRQQPFEALKETEAQEAVNTQAIDKAKVDDKRWATLGTGDIAVDSAADESCWPKDQGGAFPTRPVSGAGVPSRHFPLLAACHHLLLRSLLTSLQAPAAVEL